jgi:adenosylhomocysteine nucleosidase
VEDPAERLAFAFVCAMPMELRPLRRRLSLRRTTAAGVTLHAGTLAGRRVGAIVSGMGTSLATAACRRLLEAVPVDHVVVVGITGAVENVTPIGTLIHPEVVVDSATGAEHRPAPLGDAVPHGTMWTTDTLTPADALPGLRARGVVSLDMETAAVAAVCEERGVPWSVFRAISDRASDGSVDDEVFHLSHQDGTPDWPAIARFAVRHPGRLPGMARLGQGAKRATEAAADAAVRACGSTAGPAPGR